MSVAALRKEPFVPYVPTPTYIVRAMLDMAKVTPDDFVIDLGSGDGRIVTTAAKEYGARGLGIEIDEYRVKCSRELAERDGVGDRVTFLHADLFEADISQATVLTMYLLPEPVNLLRGKLLTLRSGSRVVSEDFRLRGWTARKISRHIVREKQRAVNSPITFLWCYTIPESAP